YQKGDLPVCEALCERVFSLPMHGYLTQEQVDFICDTIKSL
ncbi:MAG: DegT/DnrJ/EryC1/StrS family aminotransferase, partial [Clostridiales bacterium]|nr:DegT/DnrJ/EryC1/StrS family aminotransferase [Clostridiales bacterium]